MEGESGELTGPNEFLPVAHEFGLSTRVDQWVIEHTLAFMDANRRALLVCGWRSIFLRCR